MGEKERIRIKYENLEIEGTEDQVKRIFRWYYDNFVPKVIITADAE